MFKDSFKCCKVKGISVAQAIWKEHHVKQLGNPVVLSSVPHPCGTTNISVQTLRPLQSGREFSFVSFPIFFGLLCTNKDPHPQAQDSQWETLRARFRRTSPPKCFCAAVYLNDFHCRLTVLSHLCPSMLPKSQRLWPRCLWARSGTSSALFRCWRL